MRSVQSSFCGIICPISSPDTGERIGLSKQMASTVMISRASNSFLIRKILLADELITHMDKLLSKEIYGKAKVFVNGEWLGCCDASYKLLRKYRKMRRNGEIDRKTTIFHEPLTDEIYFWVDYGRVLRPILITKNNIDTITEPEDFRQELVLTKADINEIIAGKMTIHDLERKGCLEYISAEEQENCLIAESLNVLIEGKDDIQVVYTHCEMEQAIFGIPTLTSPFTNHSNPGKVIYQTNQVKQTGGWFALNYPFRTDKHSFFQNYCEMPLVKTIINGLIYPNGSNIIVAMACHTGFNQEDSMIFDGSALDRGLFTGSHYDYEKMELENGEEFATPDMSITMDIKQNANYEKLRDGFVPQGTIIEKGDVIIGKIAQIQKRDPNSPYRFIDKSLRYRENESAVIERVVISRDHEGKTFCKVKIRSYRKINNGDKLSSRSGNKGICARKFQHSDMPFSENGIVPDLIINPHCIPTRMIIGQIIESVVAKLAATKGCITDGTAFSRVNIDEISTELEKHGCKNFGKERFFCGMTGEYIDHLIFNCPTYYQRIKKFVIDESCAAVSGPTNATTRQPIEGTSRGGSYRIGEMESWAIAAHGAPRCLMQKFYLDSDGYILHICRNCGHRAVVNEQKNIYKCKFCEDNANIEVVNSSWTSKLFFDELFSMGIDAKFKLTPFD